MKHTSLTKARSVLHRTGNEDGYEVFSNDDDDDYPSRLGVALFPEFWLELGRPDTITVTIEPRDALND